MGATLPPADEFAVTVATVRATQPADEAAVACAPAAYRQARYASQERTDETEDTLESPADAQALRSVDSEVPADGTRAEFIEKWLQIMLIRVSPSPRFSPSRWP